MFSGQSCPDFYSEDLDLMEFLSKYTCGKRDVQTKIKGAGVSEMNGWRFLVVPKKEGKEIKDKSGKWANGWGSIPIKVTIGKTQWKTSLFPDKKSGTYLLPLKVAVRKKEGIFDNDTVSFGMRIVGIEKG